MFKIGVGEPQDRAGGQAPQGGVESTKPDVRPGDQVTLLNVRVTTTGRAREGGGRAPPADEGVLSLVAYRRPTRWRCSTRRGGSGETATSYGGSRTGRRARDDHAGPGDGGGDGRAAGTLRSKFLPTAYWHPPLMTDADGRVSVTFDAPDSSRRFA